MNEHDALTYSQMSALASMPVQLERGEDGRNTLPPFGPAGGTIRALERRGLIECDGVVWTRTALGEAAWGAR